jgi:hypothetical protein
MTKRQSFTDEPRIELRLRDSIQPSVQGRVAEMRERAEQLERDAVVAAADVVVWGSRIELDSASDDVGEFRETFVRFREWAARTGNDLHPGFRTHESTTMFSEESYPVVTVPIACLAVFDGDEVAAVYPHTDGDAVNTVADGFDRLEAARADGRVGTPTRTV